MSLRFLPVGPRTLLVELDDLKATLALFDALMADPVPGIADIIPAARTLMIRMDVGEAADAALATKIAARQPAPGTQPTDQAAEMVEVPVMYDGEDLDDVARFMGLTVAEVIAAHQATTWQVAFCGFAPGFAYMTCDDPRFDVPRRSAPRTRLPAGSVALAGKFGGIYPKDSPGGWQLIGRTQVPMWDLNRNPAALLRPGVRCRFVPCSADVHSSAAVPTPPPVSSVTQGLRIKATAFPLLAQDEGRKGHTGQGVSASGALDLGAMRRANRAVGNPAQSPVLEVTLGPVVLIADVPMVLALTGAAEASVSGTPIARGAAFAVDAGDTVNIAVPVAGMRSYLAVRGGFDIEPVLGSFATDTLAQIGPVALGAGAVVGLAHRPVVAAGLTVDEPNLPRAGETIFLPVTLGPRADWFDPAQVERFLSQNWRVTPASSRVGIKLEGDALTRPDSRELPSEGTETGAIQIPHAGQPVLFLADHPLTGGYPVIATLRPEALDIAGQIPPGAYIRFIADAPFADILPTRSK